MKKVLYKQLKTRFGFVILHITTKQKTIVNFNFFQYLYI